MPAAGIHGPGQCAMKPPCVSPESSPTDPLRIRRINAPRHAAALASTWDRKLASGLSLARNEQTLSSSPIPGSMVPACCFVSPPAASTARSVPDSTTRLGLPHPGRLPCLKPVAASTRRCDRLPCQPPLPFGTFTSLWIRAFDWFAACRPAFRLRPISSRSPQPVSI